MNAGTKQRRKQRITEKFFTTLAVAAISAMLFGTLAYAAVAGGNSVSERLSLNPAISREPARAAMPVVVQANEYHTSFSINDESGSIDFSNAYQGYVMARCESGREARIALDKDGRQVIQSLPADGEYHAFPLNMGDGTYGMRLLLQHGNGLYDRMVEASFNVTISDPMLRYLLPTPLAPFDEEPELTELARSMYANTETDLEFANRVFGYITRSIAYDKSLVLSEAEKSAGMTYRPDAGRAIDEGRGICSDFAAAFALMMRGSGVPCQIVYGNITTSSEGERYHAWNLVWLEDEEGGAWWRYDATLGVGAVKESAPEQVLHNSGATYGVIREIH